MDGDVITPGASVETSEAHANEPTAQVPSAIYHHKVLLTGYRLESKAFMLTYHSRGFTLESWQGFRDFCERTARRLGATAWAACLETSVRAPPGALPEPQTRTRYHTHAYYLWDDGEGVRLRNTDDFVFLRVRPRVDTCSVSNSWAFRKASRHGLWYVHVMKLGTVQAASNWEPWEDYTPAVPWLLGLWNGHKLTHDQFEMLSCRFRSGHASRMKDLGAVLRTERATAVRAHVDTELRDLEAGPALADPRPFPEVEAFVAYFKRAARRRPVLVILGPTGSGKSELARSILLKRIAVLLGLAAFLEVTVEANAALDMSSFDETQHAGILLDGVGDAQMLAGHREVLQGRAQAAKGGQSGTMMYAYPFTLARRAVVVTMDLAAANLDFFQNHHWLACETNVIVLRLTGPAWLHA